MDFYNNLITRKSWETLTKLKKKIKFVLIGGWAVYLYTKALKSKDIDIIVEYDQLERLRNDFKVSKNDRLTKYEARQDEVQIDVYLPHYSDFGIPTEEVIKNVGRLETFTVPTLELLLILKQLAYSERKLSVKGQKDKIDILGLLVFGGVDFEKYEKFLSQLGKKFLKKELGDLVRSTIEIPELEVNEHLWSRKKKMILKQL